MKEVFLIYHSEVRPIAQEIRNRLSQRLSDSDIVITMDEQAGHRGRDAFAVSNRKIASCDVILCVSSHDGLERSNYLRKEVARTRSLIARKQRSRLFLIVASVGDTPVPSLRHYAPLLVPNNAKELNETHLDQISRALEDSLSLANTFINGTEHHDWTLSTTTINVNVLNDDPIPSCDREATESFIRQAREKTPQLLPLATLMIESGSFAQFYRDLLRSLPERSRQNTSDPLNVSVSTDLLMELAMETIYTVDIPLLKTFHSIHPKLAREVEPILTALNNKEDPTSARSQIEEQIYGFKHGFPFPGKVELGHMVKNFLTNGYYKLLECLNWKAMVFSNDNMRRGQKIEQAENYLRNMLTTDLSNDSLDSNVDLRTSLSFNSIKEWIACAKVFVSLCKEKNYGYLAHLPQSISEILERDPELQIKERRSTRNQFVESCIIFGNALSITVHSLDLWQEDGSPRVNKSDFDILKRRVKSGFERIWIEGTVEKANELLLDYIKLIGISQGYSNNDQF